MRGRYSSPFWKLDGKLMILAETLKQASQQNVEYNRLADAHNKSVRRFCFTNDI